MSGLYQIRKLVAIIILFSLALLYPAQAKAFYTPNESYQMLFEQAIRDPNMNLQSFVYETLKATAGSIVFTLVGCLSCQPGEIDQGVPKMSGAIWTASNMMGLVYENPPASGVAYVVDIGSRLGVSEAYAQEGVGFSKMRLVYMPIWRAFRNIAYAFFAIIFVFIGFAIMFRVKISPQAVVTIQSAIPSIVISLILVTFSYAIVGFMIDLMFVIFNLVVTVFRTIMDSLIVDIILPRPPVADEFTSFGTIISGGFPAVFISMTIIVGSIAAAGAILGLIPTGVTQVVGGGIVIADIVIMVILIVLLFIALIRILWTLFKAYVNVVISLIFSPFILMIGAIPGNSTFGNWFRSLLANLAVLPTIAIMVLVASYIVIEALRAGPAELWNALQNALATGNWGGLFTAIGTLITSFPNLFLTAMISLGILLLTPKAADIIQSFITKKPFGYGTAMFEPLAGPYKWTTGTAGALGRTAATGAFGPGATRAVGNAFGGGGAGAVPAGAANPPAGNT